MSNFIDEMQQIYLRTTTRIPRSMYQYIYKTMSSTWCGAKDSIVNGNIIAISDNILTLDARRAVEYIRKI